MIGITLDTVDNLGQVMGKLSEIPFSIWIRICCDPGMQPSDYTTAIKYLSAAGIFRLVIQPVDSSEMANYSLQAYTNRFHDYVQAFGQTKGVVAFEAGNEINGNWCGSDVAAKVDAASEIVRTGGLKTMVTYFAQGTDEDPNFEIFNWITKNPLVYKPDLVALSVYENSWTQGCAPDIAKTFAKLANLFPARSLLIGEFGPEPLTTGKEALMEKWYTFDPEVPAYHCGGFYWDAAEDIDTLVPMLIKLGWR